MPRESRCACVGDGHPRTCFELRYHGYSPVILDEDDPDADLPPEKCECLCHEDYWDEVEDAA